MEVQLVRTSLVLREVCVSALRELHSNRCIATHSALFRDHSIMTSPQNWEFQTPLPPLSPLVTILVDPPPPYVTGATSDKLFSVTGIIKKMELC